MQVGLVGKGLFDDDDDCGFSDDAGPNSGIVRGEAGMELFETAK